MEGPNFYQFILLPSRDLHTLSMTTEFAKEHETSFLDHAYLRTPLGSEYKVELKKRGDNFWFTNGWKEFANKYSLAFLHLVVFYYQGNSRFDVHIYDDSSCEIDYAYFDAQSSVHEDEETNEGEESVEKQSSGEDLDEEQRWDEDEDEDDSESDEEQSLDNEDLEKEKGIMSQAFMKAEAIQCDNPNFIIAMTKSYVEKRILRVPMRHAQAYLEGATEAVLRVGTNPKGAAWTVTIRARRKYVLFSAGWPRFVCANRLVVGDVCRFELIDRGTHTYVVHIARRCD